MGKSTKQGEAMSDDKSEPTVIRFKKYQPETQRDEYKLCADETTPKMAMYAATLGDEAALHSSMRHWEHIVSEHLTCEMATPNSDGDTCGLCRRYVISKSCPLKHGSCGTHGCVMAWQNYQNKRSSKTALAMLNALRACADEPALEIVDGKVYVDADTESSH